MACTWYTNHFFPDPFCPRAQRLYLLCSFTALVTASSRRPSRARAQSEPAAHRRARRQRTRSRTILRQALDGVQQDPHRLVTACGRLEGHHSNSTLPAQVRAIMWQQNQGSWCQACRQYCNKRSRFCQRCGLELHASEQGQSYSGYDSGWGGAPPQPSTRGWEQQRPSAPGVWSRRTPSPRRRSRPRKQGPKADPTAGSQGSKGQSKGADWQVASWQPPSQPWPQDVARSPTLPLPPQDDGKSEILAALKAAFAASGQAPPATVMELMGKMEAVEGKALTKQLHTTAKQLGDAKQALCKIRQARQAHQTSWQQFVLKTAAAIEAGQEQFDRRILEYDQQEGEAKERVATARRALREISSKAKEDDTVQVDSDESDVELAPVAEATGSDDSCQQATKRLRTALQSICQKLPEQEETTPRRRVKAEPPQ